MTPISRAGSMPRVGRRRLRVFHCTFGTPRPSHSGDPAAAQLLPDFYVRPLRPPRAGTGRKTGLASKRWVLLGSHERTGYSYSGTLASQTPGLLSKGADHKHLARTLAPVVSVFGATFAKTNTQARPQHNQSFCEEGADQRSPRFAGVPVIQCVPLIHCREVEGN